MSDADSLDESLPALNARLRKLNDHSLGYGVLEETIKQQLRVVSRPPQFSAYARTTTKFKSVENTATLQGAMDCDQITRSVPLVSEVASQSRMAVERHGIREESIVVFQYKRVIAKRSISTPRFRDLLPVKRKTHLERGTERWLVELYGNEICTTEYYGGEASIAFRWKHDATMSTTHLMSAIQTAVTDGKGSQKSMRRLQMTGSWCNADVKGFKISDRIQGNLTTMAGVMELIRELSNLPIECAVPVSRDTVPIQTATGFPLWIQVETHIRENEILEKLTQVELQIGETEPLNARAFDLVRHLKHKVEDASMSNRLVLPRLRALANTVAETLAQHGKRVELYERRGELRLHTDNCDTKGVTSSASEMLCASTLGVGAAAVRPHQSLQFKAAPVWTVPEHYTADNFTQTHAVFGYYNRVKKLLRFDNNTLLDAWRIEIDQLPGPPVVVSTMKSLLRRLRDLFSLRRRRRRSAAQRSH